MSNPIALNPETMAAIFDALRQATPDRASLSIRCDRGIINRCYIACSSNDGGSAAFASGDTLEHVLAEYTAQLCPKEDLARQKEEQAAILLREANEIRSRINVLTVTIPGEISVALSDVSWDNIDPDSLPEVEYPGDDQLEYIERVQGILIGPDGTPRPIQDALIMLNSMYAEHGHTSMDALEDWLRKATGLPGASEAIKVFDTKHATERRI